MGCTSNVCLVACPGHWTSEMNQTGSLPSSTGTSPTPSPLPSRFFASPLIFTARAQIPATQGGPVTPSQPFLWILMLLWTIAEHSWCDRNPCISHGRKRKLRWEARLLQSQEGVGGGASDSQSSGSSSPDSSRRGRPGVTEVRGIKESFACSQGWSNPLQLGIRESQSHSSFW